MANNLKNNSYWLVYSALVFLITFTSLSCVDKKSNTPISPKGYDLSKPQKYSMPDILQEISGIAFNKGDHRTIYAEQDEEGSLFTLTLGTKDKTVTKFAGKGDYEDVAIAQNWVLILKSNGTIFSFKLNEAKNPIAANVKETKGLVPKGEYEGMYADERTGLVYVLCKNCSQDKGSKVTSGFILALQSDGSLKSSGTFKIDVSQIDQLTGKKKGTFHPSALAVNPISQEWYIVSSVNKALLVTDAKWKIKNVYHLNSNDFNQPEGIAFDASGNLYISNEGSETQTGNILKFAYKKP